MCQISLFFVFNRMTQLWMTFWLSTKIWLLDMENVKLHVKASQSNNKVTALRKWRLLLCFWSEHYELHINRINCFAGKPSLLSFMWILHTRLLGLYSVSNISPILSQTWIWEIDNLGLSTVHMAVPSLIGDGSSLEWGQSVQAVVTAAMMSACVFSSWYFWSFQLNLDPFLPSLGLPAFRYLLSLTVSSVTV